MLFQLSLENGGTQPACMNAMRETAYDIQSTDSRMLFI